MRLLGTLGPVIGKDPKHQKVKEQPLPCARRCAFTASFGSCSFPWCSWGYEGGVHMIAYCRRLLSANRCFFFFPFFRQKLLKG